MPGLLHQARCKAAHRCHLSEYPATLRGRDPPPTPQDMGSQFRCIFALDAPSPGWGVPRPLTPANSASHTSLHVSPGGPPQAGTKPKPARPLLLTGAPQDRGQSRQPWFVTAPRTEQGPRTTEAGVCSGHCPLARRGDPVCVCVCVCVCTRWGERAGSQTQLTLGNSTHQVRLA